MTFLAFALLAVLLSQWWDWPPPGPTPGAAESASPRNGVSPQPTEDLTDLSSPHRDKEEYAAVTERPLFLPDRRPPSEEPGNDEPEDQDVPSELSHLDLSAVLITPSESSAWIRDGQEKRLARVRPGDDLAGWSVQEILSDRILLERQGERDTLVLRDYKNMPPQGTTAVREPPKKPPQGQRSDQSRSARSRFERNRPDGTP